MSGPTIRQLGYWADRGWIRPDPGSRGSGNGGMTFSRSEQRVLDLMHRLTRAGLKPEAASAAARELAAGRNAVLAPGVFLSVS